MPSLFQSNRKAARLLGVLLLPLGLLAAGLAPAQFAGGNTGGGGSFNDGSGAGNNLNDGGLNSSGNGSSFGSGSFGRRGSTGSSRSSRNSRNGNETDVDARRSSRDEERLRSRNSNERGAGAKATGTGRKGKEMVQTKGKQAKPAGGGGGEARAPLNIEFKMKVDPATNVLFLEGGGLTPTYNVAVGQGETFVTRCGLSNGRGSAFETVRVSLKYDPTVLQPLAIDDDMLSTSLAGQARAQVDEAAGRLHWQATLATSSTAANTTFFKVRWKATAPTKDSAITFLNSAESPSYVVNGGGSNILLSRGSEDLEVEPDSRAGLLGTSVAISADASTASKLEYAGDTLGAITLANSISAGTAEGGVSLQLRRRPQPAANGDLLVDVQYSNPQGAQIDAMKIRLRFDPQYLEVVDTDKGNWITRGVNILDGPYHEALPFDFHRRNSAFNSTGEIQYEMGFNAQAQIPRSGTVATIRFRPLQSTPSTAIFFDLDEKSVEGEHTALTFLGFNLIGRPGERRAYTPPLTLTLN